jgi:predicted RNA binding protein YcfA (HicA-like mRNA interferase family)
MKLRPLKRREIVRILKENGYGPDPKHSVKGSHEMWWNPKTKRMFPLPTYDEFGVPLLKLIIRESGIPREKFV